MNLLREESKSPGTFKECLKDLLEFGTLSESFEGNYSLLFDGKNFNYRLDGKILYFTDINNASSLPYVLSADITNSFDLISRFSVVDDKGKRPAF